VFVDVVPEVYTLDPDDVRAKLGSRTRAIMVVDVFGHPADWDQITQIARSADLRVVDDACEALGAAWNGRPVGTMGDTATFAFYPNKQITTGEGGVLVTSSAAIDQLARSLRNQGRDQMGAWLDHPRLGYNYRLDEMSAALGVSQMRRIDQILARREQVAARYGRLLEAIDGVDAPTVLPEARVSWFVYVVRLAQGIDRDRVMRVLGDHGIASRAYFSPIHVQPYVRERLGDLAGTLPVTEAVARQTLALPFHGRLSEEEADRVVEVLSAAVAAAS
jgi:perosamine synthetase